MKQDMLPEEKFTRKFVGIMLILATFVTWGKWVSLVFGILFLVSAFQGYCLTCEIYKKFHRQKKI